MGDGRWEMGANYLIVNSLGCNDGRVTCPYVTGWLIGPYPPHSRACRDTRPYRGRSEMAFFMVDIAAVRQLSHLRWQFELLVRVASSSC